jgi:hypothetical protein
MAKFDCDDFVPAAQNRQSVRVIGIMTTNNLVSKSSAPKFKALLVF